MADEPEVQEEELFDAAAAAAELEAERAAGGGEPEPDEDDDDGEVDDAAAAAEKADADKVKKPPEEDESDDDFLKKNEGKPVSFAAFKKRLDRAKKRYEEAAGFKDKYAKLEEEYGSYKKTQPFGPETQQKFSQYESIFGNLRTGLSKLPFLDDAVAALAQGKQPDLHVLHKALGEYVEALPQADPRLLQAQEELRLRLDRAEELEFDRSFNALVERENQEVKKLLGENADPEFLELVESVYVNMIPEKGELKDLPSKADLVKRMLDWSKKQEQAVLKKQLPGKTLKRLAPAGASGGPAGAPKATDDEKIPEPGTQEWDEWVAKAYQKR